MILWLLQINKCFCACFVICIWNYPNLRFGWFRPFLWLYSGVDLIVNSHTWPYGHFTGCTKNKITNNREWKEEKTNTDSKLQNAGRWSWHFLTFSVCMYGYSKNSAKILHSHQRCWLIWSSSSLLRVFILDSTLPSNCSGPTS